MKDIDSSTNAALDLSAHNIPLELSGTKTPLELSGSHDYQFQRNLPKREPHQPAYDILSGNTVDGSTQIIVANSERPCTFINNLSTGTASTPLLNNGKWSQSGEILVAQSDESNRSVFIGNLSANSYQDLAANPERPARMLNLHAVNGANQQFLPPGGVQKRFQVNYQGLGTPAKYIPPPHSQRSVEYRQYVPQSTSHANSLPPSALQCSQLSDYTLSADRNSRGSSHVSSNSHMIQDRAHLPPNSGGYWKRLFRRSRRNAQARY